MISEADKIAGAPANDQMIILKNVYKITRVRVYPTRDKNTGRFLGGVKNVDSQGDAILNEEERKLGADAFAKATDSITLEDGMSFDLTNPHDAKVWSWVKHSTKVADSWEDAQRSPSAEFYVYIPEQEAEKTVNRVSNKYKALQYVMEDSRANHYTICRLLGNKMDSVPYSQVQEFLLDMAEKHSQKIISVYTDSTVKTKLFLLDALEKEVIVLRNQVYTYQNEILGISEEAVIEWLQNPKNKNIVNMIYSEVYPEYTADETKENKSTKKKTTKKSK